MGEAADRAAVEKLWTEWDPLTDQVVGKTPEEQRKLLSTHAVDPVLQRAIDGAARMVAQKIGTYGSETIKHNFSWPNPISGGDTAVLHDCVDNSKTGTYDLGTGKKLTRGPERDPAQVTAVRTPDGWRLKTFRWLEGQSC